jgi:tetratricopeptide (TPR) repeat protein
MLLNRGELCFQMGEYADAERWARRAADLYAEVFAHGQKAGHPVDPRDLLYHAMSEGLIAVSLRERGKPADAAAVQDQLVPRLTGFLKTYNTRDHQHECYLAQIERAVTLSHLPARRAAGVADLDAALLGCENLAKQFPQFPAYLRAQGVATLQRGRLNVLLDQREAAGKDLAAALIIFEGLVAKYPDIPLYRNYLGQAYLAAGQNDTDPAKAAEFFRKSREMLDWAAARSPDDAQLKKARAELDAVAK